MYFVHSTLSGAAALLIITLSRIFVTSAVDTDCGRSSEGGEGFTADSLLSRSKKTIKCVSLIWQCGLAHDGIASAFVACDVLDCLPHIFVVLC